MSIDLNSDSWWLSHIDEDGFTLHIEMETNPFSEKPITIGEEPPAISGRNTYCVPGNHGWKPKSIQSKES